MSREKFSKPQIEVARQRVETLFVAFNEATGFPLTFISEVASGDRAFRTNLAKQGMTFATYDRVAGRLSALWPDGLAWPADIPRPAPVDIPEDILAILAQRAAKADAAGGVGGSKPGHIWPKGVPWPADIPRPDHTNEASSNG